MTEEVIELTPDLRLQYSAAYRYSDAVIKKHGQKKFFLDGKYKRYKELFVGALMAQMCTETSGEYHFVTLGSDPPDFTLRVMRKHNDEPDKTDELSYPFELTDYTEHDSSISDVIDKKLTGHNLLGQSLVVLFRHPQETTYDLDLLRQQYASVKAWLLIVMKVDRTNSGILLPEERWLIASLTKPYKQNLIKPDKIDRSDLEQMWVQKFRGKDKIFNQRPVKLRLPD